MSETVKKPKEPGMARLVIVLFTISAVTALLLGLVNMVTAPAIAANAEKNMKIAMNAVLSADTYDQVDYNGADPLVKAVYQAGDAGFVVQVAPSGFGGEVTLMVGVDNDGACTGISIISQSETPGLGAKSTDAEWQSQFVGKSGTLAVQKDGGDIQALTGATITSRAVTKGVNSALETVKSMG